MSFLIESEPSSGESNGTMGVLLATGHWGVGRDGDVGGQGMGMGFVKIGMLNGLADAPQSLISSDF